MCCIFETLEMLFFYFYFINSLDICEGKVVTLTLLKNVLIPSVIALFLDSFLSGVV